MRKPLFFALVCLVGYGYSQEAPDLAAATAELAATGKYLSWEINFYENYPDTANFESNAEIRIKISEIK